jgi:hypothetical protein
LRQESHGSGLMLQADEIRAKAPVSL